MRTTVAIVIVSCAAATAHADIIYLSDSRTLSAAATAPNNSAPTQNDSASGPVFNTSVTCTANYNGFPAGSTTSTATQHSELLADRITGTGGGSASINIGGGSLGGYFGDAHSDMVVTFHVDVATPFSLAATATSNGFPPPPPATILFSFSGGNLPSALVLNPGSSPINLSGTLDAGDYTVEAHARNTAGFSSGWVESFDFTLIVPSPASGIPLLASLGLLMRRRRA